MAEVGEEEEPAAELPEVLAVVVVGAGRLPNRREDEHAGEEMRAGMVVRPDSLNHWKESGEKVTEVGRKKNQRFQLQIERVLMKRAQHCKNATSERPKTASVGNSSSNTPHWM